MRMYTQKELVKLLEDSIVNRKCVKINDIVCEPYLVGTNTNVTKNTVLLVRVRDVNEWRLIPLNEIYTIQSIEPTLQFEPHPEFFNNVMSLFGLVKIKCQIRNN